MIRSVLLAIVAGMMSTAATAPPPMIWVTLGTKGGPLPSAERSQPANALLIDERPWIVDCGDGAMERLAGAGYRPADVDTVFISHLHLDHVGGLQGLIGLRWMSGSRTTLTIYGPPGTQQLVDGLLRSMRPSIAISANEPMRGLDPSAMVRVAILRDGSSVTIGDTTVHAVQNTHFNGENGKPFDNGSQSLSYRFSRDGYSVVFTGDTGPSPSVTRLAKGADLLVSEVVDLDQARRIYATKNDMAEEKKAEMLRHLATQHLTPDQAGMIAANAGVKRLVFTHLSIYGPTAVEAPRLIAGARKTFQGKVEVARDLDRF